MAVLYEHPPARAPYVPYSDGLGKSHEGLATVRSPVGVNSLPVRLPAARPDSESIEQAPLLQGDPFHLKTPFWTQKEWFPELQSLAVAPPVPLPLRRELLRQPHFHHLHQNSPCFAFMRGDFPAINLPFRSLQKTQLSLCRRQSSRRLYQHRWECYRSWCTSRGHSVSSSAVAEIAKFLCFLGLDKHLSISVIRGYHSAITAIFKFHLPKLLDNCVMGPHSVFWVTAPSPSQLSSVLGLG